jgi:hypothetical protein
MCEVSRFFSTETSRCCCSGADDLRYQVVCRATLGEPGVSRYIDDPVSFAPAECFNWLAR